MLSWASRHFHSMVTSNGIGQCPRMANAMTGRRRHASTAASEQRSLVVRNLLKAQKESEGGEDRRFDLGSFRGGVLGCYTGTKINLIVIV